LKGFVRVNHELQQSEMVVFIFEFELFFVRCS